MIVRVPLAVGAAALAWPLLWLVAWGVGWVECWPEGQVQTEVMAWNLVWLVLAVSLTAMAGWLFARRDAVARAVAGTGLTVVALVIGAELGWALAMGLAGCERTDEGPGLTLALFTIPAAGFGLVAGWLWRRSAR